MQEMEKRHQAEIEQLKADLELERFVHEQDMRAKTVEYEELQTKFKTLQKQRLEEKRELAELTKAKSMV